MKNNAGAFAVGLMKHVDGIKTQSKDSVRKIAFSAWQLVTSGSPVDKGTFRANWRVAVNHIDTSINDSTTAQSYPDPEFDVGDDIYISNSMPYSTRIESGHSKQAPQGVVKPALVELRDLIKKGVFS